MLEFHVFLCVLNMRQDETREVSRIYNYLMCVSLFYPETKQDKELDVGIS